MTRATSPHRDTSASACGRDDGRTSRTSTLPDGWRSSGDNSRSVAPQGGIALARPFNEIPTRPTTPSSRSARPSRPGSIGGRPNWRVRTTRDVPRGGPSSGRDTRRAASGPPSRSPQSQAPPHDRGVDPVQEGRPANPADEREQHQPGHAQGRADARQDQGDREEREPEPAKHVGPSLLLAFLFHGGPTRAHFARQSVRRHVRRLSF